MAHVVIHVDEVAIAVGDNEARPDDAQLSMYADVFGDRLSVVMDLEGDNKEGAASFQINGIAQIDALRRFCEMAIDHYRAGEIGK